METLLGTKFAVRKILLLMISGIFLVGCAYQTSAFPSILELNREQI